MRKESNVEKLAGIALICIYFIIAIFLIFMIMLLLDGIFQFLYILSLMGMIISAKQILALTITIIAIIIIVMIFIFYERRK